MHKMVIAVQIIPEKLRKSSLPSYNHTLKQKSIVGDMFHWMKESRQSSMIKQISSLGGCAPDGTCRDGDVCITSFLEVHC